MSFKVSNAKKIGINTLVGSVDLETPSGIRFRGVMLHRKNGSSWIQFASREWIGTDGQKRYMPVVEFVTPEVKEKFTAQVLPLIAEALSAGDGVS